MFAAYAPSTHLSQSLDLLLSHLAGVRDGSEEAIHDARVGIRRVREAMALARAEYDQDELGAIEHRLARAARALSRARDADVGQRLTQKVEARFPLAAGTLGRLRAAISAEQIKSRSKAVKKLEALDLESLPQQIQRARTAHASRWMAWAPWRATLRRQMMSRAADVRAAIERASGLYFPNRVHAARVTIKQLRYTLELAERTGTWRAPRALRLLRKVQDALGAAHDGEVLLARLDELDPAGATRDREEVEALEQFIRADILARHARYVAWRPDVLAVCDACTAAARESGARTRALLAAGVVLPSLLLLHRRREDPHAPGLTATTGPREPARREEPMKVRAGANRKRRPTRVTAP